jgi:hypothetical protein
MTTKRPLVVGLKKPAPAQPVVAAQASVVVEPVAALTKRELTPQELAHRRIKAIEDEVLEDALRVVSSSQKFAEVTTLAKPPQSWVERWGEEEANLRFRIAQMANVPEKDAPIGMKIAAKTAVGIIKARETGKMGPLTLNLQMVAMTAPPKTYDEVEVEGG